MEISSDFTLTRRYKELRQHCHYCRIAGIRSRRVRDPVNIVLEFNLIFFLIRFGFLLFPRQRYCRYENINSKCLRARVFIVL